MTEEKRIYVQVWQKKNIARVRMHKRMWYYRNRKIINLMFSKPKGIGEDEADLWYKERHPEG